MAVAVPCEELVLVLPRVALRRWVLVTVVRAVLLVIIIMAAPVPPAITPALRRAGGGGDLFGDALDIDCFGGRLMEAARHRAVA